MKYDSASQQLNGCIGRKDALLKYTSLVVLTIQTAVIILLIRYARVRPTNAHFLSTTTVFWTEVTKLFASFLFVVFDEKGLFKACTAIYEAIVHRKVDTLKVWIPAIIYTCQNNLFYVGLSNLDAATFAITYQLKLVTTALFAVAILRKPLSKLQWVAIVTLSVGVAIVQVQEQSQSSNASNIESTGSTSINDTAQQNPFLGFIAVLLVCVMSGFAGIYYEKILKTDTTTIWIQNVRLAVLGIPISFVTIFLKDGAIVREKGLTYDYDYVIWCCVFTYALGGLLVALCIKYADNILKGFSQCLAVVLSCIASMFFFSFVPNFMFLIGAFLVLLSVYLYSAYPPSKIDNK